MAKLCGLPLCPSPWMTLLFKASHKAKLRRRENSNRQQVAWGWGREQGQTDLGLCGLCRPFILTFSSSLPPPISAVGKGGRQDRKYLHCKPDRTEGVASAAVFLPQPTLVHKQPTHQAGISLPTLLGPNKPGQSLGWDLGAWVPPSHGTYFLRFPHPRPSGEGLRQVRLPGGPAQGHPDTAPGDAQESRRLQSTRGRTLTSLQVAVRSSPRPPLRPPPARTPRLERSLPTPYPKARPLTWGQGAWHHRRRRRGAKRGNLGGSGLKPGRLPGGKSLRRRVPPDLARGCAKE